MTIKDDLWPVAIYDLGLSSNEFGRLTFRQFDHLVKRFSISIDRQEFRVAKLCSSIYNASGTKKLDKTEFSPEDFLPKKEIEQGNLLKKVEALNRMFGGLDNRKN